MKRKVNVLLNKFRNDEYIIILIEKSYISEKHDFVSSFYRRNEIIITYNYII